MLIISLDESIGSGNGDTSGNMNILFGNYVAQNSTDIGHFNTVMGHASGQYLNGGYRNTGYGYSSLNKLTSGVNNIGLGICWDLILLLELIIYVLVMEQDQQQ